MSEFTEKACNLNNDNRIKQEILLQSNSSIGENSNIDSSSQSALSGVFDVTSKIASSIELDIENVSKSECDQRKTYQKTPDYKYKKRRRNSLCFLTQWAWSDDSMKRACRNKTSAFNEKFSDSFLEKTFKQIIPADLIIDEKPESLNDLNNCSIQEWDCKVGEDSSEKLSYFGSEQESADVKHFFAEYEKKNIMHFMIRFLSFLSKKWNYKWPRKLVEIYTLIYMKLKKYLIFPNSNPTDIINVFEGIDPDVTLLYCELYADAWVSSKIQRQTLHRFNWKEGILPDDIGLIILNAVSENCKDLERKQPYKIRSLWLIANVLLWEQNKDSSLQVFQTLYEFLKLHFSPQGSSYIELMNCENNRNICLNEVQNMIKFIRREQDIEKIQKLYKNKNYELLLDILKDTIKVNTLNVSKLYENSSIKRDKLLYILLECLWQLQNLEDCVVWCEKVFDESWSIYTQINKSSNNLKDCKNWSELILNSLELFNSCLEKETHLIVKSILKSQRYRLLHNLIQLICHQTKENIVDVSLQDNVQPWIILFYLLLHEEDSAQKLTAVKMKNGEMYKWSNANIQCIPSSVMMLIKAHEVLGNYGRCCISEGRILKFMLKCILPKWNSPLYATVKYELKKPLEQIFYCLFGYPNKLNLGKQKPKYFQDHVKNHIDLTWDTCQYLFDFYKPENWPNFQSKRHDSISADTVALFKKISTLLPIENDLTKMAEKMENYLSGNISYFPINDVYFLDQVTYVYYLIADYYFKTSSNQSWASAVKYYILDLCLHPNELNSWAGLAMSITTLLETSLNNFHPTLNEESYLRKATMAQQSFKHAIELSPTNLTIWTEFGNFMYSVHSFCSRLLKQESESLNINKFRIFETRKEKMLKEAKRCFTIAHNIFNGSEDNDEIQDERWLFHYMLGKIAEKMNENPFVFLKHYLQANDLLRINKAEYPERISHKNPQNLSIEALEIHYRIYASILKYLEQNEEKPLEKSLGSLFEHSLETCLQVHYTQCKSFFKKRKSLYKIQSEAENKKIKAVEGTEEIEDVLKNLVNIVCENAHYNEESLIYSLNNDNKACDSRSFNSTYSNNINSYGPFESSCSIDLYDQEPTFNVLYTTREKDTYFSKDKVENIIRNCLNGLELCKIRFPEHYKSVYRLAYFYYHCKSKKDLGKSKQLLLNSYKSEFHKKKIINGLFAERRNSNFFNGIWRIPVDEIDRPGSFASHMSRCITLLMQVLKESGDNQMLIELSQHLQKTPEVDKKYLKDGERKQLAFQALSLVQQCLRVKIKSHIPEQKLSSCNLNSDNEQIQVLLDIYQTYQAVKKIHEYGKSILPSIRKLLSETYELYFNKDQNFCNSIDAAKALCRLIMKNKKYSCSLNTSKIRVLNENSSCDESLNQLKPSFSNSSAVIELRAENKSFLHYLNENQKTFQEEFNASSLLKSDSNYSLNSNIKGIVEKKSNEAYFSQSHYGNLNCPSKYKEINSDNSKVVCQKNNNSLQEYINLDNSSSKYLSAQYAFNKDLQSFSRNTYSDGNDNSKKHCSQNKLSLDKFTKYSEFLNEIKPDPTVDSKMAKINSSDGAELVYSIKTNSRIKKIGNKDVVIGDANDYNQSLSECDSEETTCLRKNTYDRNYEEVKKTSKSNKIEDNIQIITLDD